MTFVLAAGVAIVAFLAGSIPFGLLISRFVFGVDLREHGSGNIGAANAMRTIGKGGAIATLVLDALKGYLPTVFAVGHFGLQLGFLAGIAATLGHCFTPWLRFRGGKGVATLLGTLLAVQPVIGFGCIVVYGVMLWMLRISAIGSLSAGAFGMIGLAIAYGKPGFFYGAFGFLLLIFTHRSNIERLRSGNENRFVSKKPEA